MMPERKEDNIGLSSNVQRLIFTEPRDLVRVFSTLSKVLVEACLRLLEAFFFAFCFTSISVDSVVIAAAAIDVRVVFLIVFVEYLAFLDSMPTARLLLATIVLLLLKLPLSIVLLALLLPLDLIDVE
uniref:Uncharacterized protein n=1 Tax=Glossina brevipalpis TaxID=37001 RepID=A0A1A9WJY3_9MUSC